MIAVAWVKFNDRKEPIQTEVCEVCPGVVNVRTLNLEDYAQKLPQDCDTAIHGQSKE